MQESAQVGGVGAMLVGRDTEIADVTALIDSAPVESTYAILRGEAGIGKTALLNVALRRAEEQRYTILVARPTRAEVGLPFAVLADLVGGVDLSPIETPRRKVLEIALGRRDGNGRPPFANELAMAFVAVVDSLIGRGPPLLIAIDDVQWVDLSTSEVLQFAFRRLPATGVCVLVTERRARAGKRAQTSAIDVDGGHTIEVRPLGPAATETIVRMALPAVVPDHVVHRVIAASAGNPLYALEFARATIDAVTYPGRPLPVPAPIGAMVSARFESLPPSSIEALAVVAMMARPSTEVLSDLGVLDHLRPAEAAGIVEVQVRSVGFTHPVLASAAYESVTGSQRLGLHRRLASATSGDESCIHRALGSTHPDAHNAAELEDIAVRYGERGASAEAADIGLLALAATPDGDPHRWARVVTVGDLLFRAGRTDEAIDQVRSATGEPIDDEIRAKALLLWATIEFARQSDTAIAKRYANQCLDIAVEPALVAAAHSILARVEYEDFGTAARHADAALAIVRETPGVSPTTLAGALTASAAAGFNAGHGLDRTGLEQAIVLERGTNVLVSDSAQATLAALLKYTDQLEEAHQMFLSVASQSDPASLPYALGHLPQLLLWLGRWDEAEARARDHLEVAEQTNQQSQTETARFNLAVVAAHRGQAALAEPLARSLSEQGQASGSAWTERTGAGLLGFISMTTGHDDDAVRHFARYDELGEKMKLYEPGYCRFHGDYVEVLVATGDLERAGEVVERVGARAARLGRVSSAAGVARGRALVAARAGEHDRSLGLARSAIAMLEPTALIYDRARSWLTLGLVARRFQERTVARDALGRAVEAFELMGGASFAARGRRELDRLSGRAPASGAGSDELTATETSVAELAAAGRTTRQIAEALFISVKTVEANLTRVYRKLGVANRAQLANRMATRK